MSIISTDKIVELFYKVSKELRNTHYRYQVDEFENPIKIVSEGDSWFHFPLMPILKDVVNHLIFSPDSPYAVYSVGHPGDDLVTYVKRDDDGNLKGDIIDAVAKEQPQFLLLSGGGNDILRSDLGRMKRIVKEVDSNDLDRAAQDYLTIHYTDTLLPKLMGVYKDIFDHIEEFHPECHVLTHSYGYLQPLNDDYIEEPLEKLGFNSANFAENKTIKMQQVTKEIIDAFHVALEAVVGQYSNVHLIDCRDVLHPDDWFDEGHPSTHGCGKMCDKFSDKMLELLDFDELPTLIPKEEEEDGE